MNLTEASHIARKLMNSHGISDTWRFEYDGGKRRFGAAHYGPKKITLSRHLVSLNDQETVTDVILHEIAHVLAGSQAGHGPVWKRTAREIGANPERCYETDNVNTVPGNYTLSCPSCGYSIQRYRKTKTRYTHRKCNATMVWDNQVPQRIAASIPTTQTTKAIGNFCRDCNAVIPPSGKRGRPAVRCINCR